MSCIPDPIEIMESRIDRMVDGYLAGKCYGCSEVVGMDNLVQATPHPDAPAVCFKCAGIEP